MICTMILINNIQTLIVMTTQTNMNMKKGMKRDMRMAMTMLLRKNIPTRRELTDSEGILGV